MSLDLDMPDEGLRAACTHGDGCPVCAIWQQPGESDAEWKARLRTMWNVTEARPAFGPPKSDDPYCRNGHPWAENTRANKRGYRVCRMCDIESNRAWRRRQRERRQEAVA